MYQRQVRTLEEQLGRSVGLYVPPFHFYFCVVMCVLDRNCLTSLLWRSLQSRSVQLNRQRRSASSQKQTRRCPRARCSSQRMQQQRRRSKAVSEREQAEWLAFSRSSTLYRQKMGLCVSLGNCSAWGVCGYIRFSFFSFGRWGMLPCCPYFMSLFHIFVYLLIVSFFFCFFMWPS